MGFIKHFIDLLLVTEMSSRDAFHHFLCLKDPPAAVLVGTGLLSVSALCSCSLTSISCSFFLFALYLFPPVLSFNVSHALSPGGRFWSCTPGSRLLRLRFRASGSRSWKWCESLPTCRPSPSSSSPALQLWWVTPLPLCHFHCFFKGLHNSVIQRQTNQNCSQW